MKILITGSNGMVGTNLKLYLKKNTTHTLLTPKKLELNLLNYEFVYRYLLKEKPDLIIHCAGKVGGIQANINEPVEFFVDNLEMGKNLILAAKRAKIKKLINLGSSCIYPPDNNEAIEEEQLLTGKLEKTNEGYALAKLSIIKLCEYINLQYSEYMYKTLIPCNLFGKYDKFDGVRSHMIPAAIKKIHQAKLKNDSYVDIWGNGNVRREFMYAGDLSKIISKCIDKFHELPQVMNVGLGYDYTVNEYYQIIADVIGYKGEFRHLLDKPVGMKRKLLNVERMKSLGLSIDTDIKSCIDQTYQFYLKTYVN